MVGSAADLCRVLTIAETLGPELGLQLGDCLIWSPCPDADFTRFPAWLPTQIGSGFKLLGASIGDRAAAEAYAARRVEQVATMVESLELLEDVQLQYSLLKFCVGLPRFISISCG